jgi:RNA polymerase sigma factor (sigma-70 family)
MPPVTAPAIDLVAAPLVAGRRDSQPRRRRLSRIVLDGDDVLTLVRACADGDASARRTFQDRHAEDIYNFPVKIYGVAAERAADFYVYVFERDRIFTRIRSFEGRNQIQFRTFLAYYVLRSLFLEWQRGMRELDTVTMDDGDVDGVADPTPAPEHRPGGDVPKPWTELAPEEQLDLKLLSLLEYHLTPGDLRLLARVSRRSLDETRLAVAEVEADLRRKDVAVSRLRDDLDSVWGWIVLRRRELQDVEDKLRMLGTGQTTAEARRLRERREELEQSLAKRDRQRERLLEQVRSAKMTTPYKDIARLLNTTVGTVCSRIFRLRERLARRMEVAP